MMNAIISNQWRRDLPGGGLTPKDAAVEVGSSHHIPPVSRQEA